jgi:hypothetical protein
MTKSEREGRRKIVSRYFSAKMSRVCTTNAEYVGRCIIIPSAWFDYGVVVDVPYRTIVSDYIHNRQVHLRRWSFTDPNGDKVNFCYDELLEWLAAEEADNDAVPDLLQSGNVISILCSPYGITLQMC